MYNGWKIAGYDPCRTSRTLATGRINTPQLAWQLDMSACDYFISGKLGASNMDMSLRSMQIEPVSAETWQMYGLASPLLDVAGDGQRINPPQAPGARWGKFLPNTQGLQRISWTTTWGENAHFQMHRLRMGIDRPRIVWDVPFNGAMYAPLVIVTDLDGDGRFEIGLPGFHDGFRCLDPATGQTLWTIPQHGNSASNCVSADINGDGSEEFIYADGSRLLAVAKSYIVWQIELPASIQNIVVADIDGDNSAEILAGGNNGILYGVTAAEVSHEKN